MEIIKEQQLASYETLQQNLKSVEDEIGVARAEEEKLITQVSAVSGFVNELSLVFKKELSGPFANAGKSTKAMQDFSDNYLAKLNFYIEQEAQSINHLNKKRADILTQMIGAPQVNEVAQPKEITSPGKTTAQTIKDLEVQLRHHKVVAKYKELYPTPEDIKVPEDRRTLPEVFPSLYDIGVAIDKAEKDLTYVSGIQNSQEIKDRIAYLKLLREKSPETKMIDLENEKQGVNTFNISFSTDQALFVRGLFAPDNSDNNLNSLETSFSDSLSESDKEKYGPDDAGTVRRARDFIQYLEQYFISKGEKAPEWLRVKKNEFEALFPTTALKQ